MASVTSATTVLPQTVLPTDWTLADLQQHLGGVALERIRLYPPPGMATVEDALAIHDRENRLCELVDGILVEKIMGSYESLLAGLLIHWMHQYLDANPRGIVLAPDGALRILAHKMRIPDVSFISWDKFPNRKLPRDRVFAVAPDLAVEILSEGNSPKEMELKLDEYFRAGAGVVWFIDPERRKAQIYTSRTCCEELDDSGVLSAGGVLPGFELPLKALLDKVDRAAD
jgi:Uma2 family endonuclease